MKKLLLLAATLVAFTTSSLVADSITQITSVSAAKSGDSGYITANLSAPWYFQAFDASQGTLTSVAFDVSISADIGVFDRNVVFVDGITDNLSVYLNSSVFGIKGSSPLSIPALPSAGIIGPKVFVPYNGSFSVTGTVNVNASYFLTDPSNLGFFSTPDAYLFVNEVVIGPNFAGSVRGSSTTNMKLTYNYTVPEASSTLLMLGLTLAGIFGMGGRRVEFAS